MVTTEASVLKFLKDFKDVMANGGRGLDIVPRPETNETVIELGLTRANIVAEIFELSVLDYCSGPEQDHSRPGFIWKFGKRIMKCEVYIKLKLAEIGNTKIAKCISFHKANYKINYPLRK